jgi:hypothetical protein
MRSSKSLHGRTETLAAIVSTHARGTSSLTSSLLLQQAEETVGVRLLRLRLRLRLLRRHR